MSQPSCFLPPLLFSGPNQSVFPSHFPLIPLSNSLQPLSIILPHGAGGKGVSGLTHSLWVSAGCINPIGPPVSKAPLSKVPRAPAFPWEASRDRKTPASPAGESVRSVHLCSTFQFSQAPVVQPRVNPHSTSPETLHQPDNSQTDLNINQDTSSC